MSEPVPQAEPSKTPSAEEALAVLAENVKYLEMVAQEKKEVVDAEEKIEARKLELSKMSPPCRVMGMVGDKLAAFFEEGAGIPEKQAEKLTPLGLRIVGLGAKACFAAVLIAFTYTGYQSDQATKYISLDSTTTETDKSSSYRKCLTVPYAINAVFSVDTNGIWSGASAYIPGKGKYKFIFNSFEKSAETYKTFMTDVKSVIDSAVVNTPTTKLDGTAAAYGSPAASRNVMLNLAYFMSWTYKKTDTTKSGASVTDYISFKGDPAYVFDRFSKTAVLGAAEKQCYAIPTVSYDRATASMTVAYDYGEATVTIASPTGIIQSVSFTSTSTPLTTFTASATGATLTVSAVTLGSVSKGTTFIYNSVAYIVTDCQGSTPTFSCTIAFSTTPQTGSGYLGTNQDTMNPIGCCPPFTSIYSVDNSKCILPPGDYGYDRGVDKDHFSLKYNLWTLTTAFAVNQGIVPYGILNVVQTDLTKSPKGCYSLNSDCSSSGCTGTQSSYSLLYESGTCSITVSNTKYYIEARMDSRYPGMNPIYCLVTKTNSNSATVCFVRMGSTFALPYMNHMGTSAISGDYYNYQQWCLCKEPDFSIGTSDSAAVQTIKNFYMNNANVGLTGGVSNKFFAASGTYLGKQVSAGGNGYCNMFDLLHGLVIIKGKYYDTVLAQFITALSPYTAEQINLMATLSGWTSLKVGGNAGAQIPRTMQLSVKSGTGSGAGTSGQNTIVVVGKLSDGDVLTSGIIGNYVTMRGSNSFQFPDNTVITGVANGSNTAGSSPEMLGSSDPDYSFCASLSSKDKCIRATLTLSNKLTYTYTYAAGQTVAINTISVGPTKASDINTATGIAYGSTASTTTNAFSWCTPTGSNCAVLAVNTKDVLDQRINEEGGVTVSSSCSDDFSIDSTSWVSSDGTTGISIVPPTSLFNDYYECYNTVSKSVLLAFGAGSGSAGSITPAFVMFLLVFVARFLVKNAVDTAVNIGQAVQDRIDDYNGVPRHDLSRKDHAAIEMTWSQKDDNIKETHI